MAITEFKAALNQVATERGINVEDVLESIRIALDSAYKKDYNDEDDIEVIVDPDTGEAKIMLEDKDVTPAGFGRIAAQTAKQVILQKIRETERQVIFDEFENKIGTIISGVIFRIENGRVILDLGKAHGILPQTEQVETESYRVNQRLKVYVKDVKQGTRGTEIILSRSDANFVKMLFEQEVPEISTGVVEIKSIAREAGSRTKMAVHSNDDKIDPVGSCVGQKGVRVQSIISELFGEKIDIVPFSEDPEKFIAASLSPAKVTSVTVDEEEMKATVSVPEDQQSLAIGKEGQNARLANKLTRWKIDIKGAKGIFEVASENGETSDEQVVGVWDAAIKKVEESAEDTNDKDADEETIEEATIETETNEENTEDQKEDANETKEDIAEETEEDTTEESKENEDKEDSEEIEEDK